MTKSEEMKRLEAAMASDKELYEKFYKTADRLAGEKTAHSDGELFAKAAQELGSSQRQTLRSLTLKGKK